MKLRYIPDSKVHGAQMGPTWVLSAPGGPHVGPMNLVIRDVMDIIKDISEMEGHILDIMDIFFCVEM